MTTELEKYFDRLWPLCRSITGNGLRQSFAILSELIPLTLEEIPTGTKAFDWEVPKEWNIDDAYIITPDGRKICDFKENNLHILNYAIPFEGEMSFEELQSHLYTRPDLPDAIPYVTSYYKEKWGFCLSHNDFQKLPRSGAYKIYIHSTLKPGHLTLGHLVLKGETEKEVLLSSYLCHPSMANNELSGPLTLAFLYKRIHAMPRRRYSYRFILAPETIGVIAYLAKYGVEMKARTEAGYVLTCVGTDADPVYKRSKRGCSLADRAAEHVLRFSGRSFSTIPFSIGGSDERQYCSPGFNLPVGSLIRSMYQKYPEYHTSLDNKQLLSFEAMKQTIDLYFDIIHALELNAKYTNTNPYCEAQLGKRGLYPDSRGALWKEGTDFTRMVLHTLAFADGDTDLFDIAEKYGQPIHAFQPAIECLLKNGLLR